MMKQEGLEIRELPFLEGFRGKEEDRNIILQMVRIGARTSSLAKKGIPKCSLNFEKAEDLWVPRIGMIGSNLTDETTHYTKFYDHTNQDRRSGVVFINPRDLRYTTKQVPTALGLRFIEVSLHVAITPDHAKLDFEAEFAPIDMGEKEYLLDEKRATCPLFRYIYTNSRIQNFTVNIVPVKSIPKSWDYKVTHSTPSGIISGTLDIISAVLTAVEEKASLQIANPSERSSEVAQIS